MKNLAITHNERRERLKAIRQALDELDIVGGQNIEVTFGYKDIMNVVPMLVLKFYTHYEDEDNQAGYSIAVDRRTYEVTRVAWFRAKGGGTYRRSVLNHEELEDFKRYYKKYFQNLRHDFCSTCNI